jgi:hypothetical protein
MIKQENKSLHTAWIYFSLLIVTLVLLFPVLFSREASFCINPDNRDQAYPFFNKLASSLHKGYLPVWDANPLGGRNFSGEFQPGIFYPLNILWCLLFGNVNGIDVYYLDVLVVLHYFICLLGMYQLGRVLKFSQIASIVSGLIFTFTGILASRANAQTCIFFGLALLPWALYFIFRYYLVRPLKKYLAAAGLILGLEILAGHIQPFFHTVLIGGLVIVYYEYTNLKSWKNFALSVTANIFIILLLAIIISLPQLYYSVEYMSQCYRWVGAEYPVGPGEKVPQFVYAHKNIMTLSNLSNLFDRYNSEPDDNNNMYMGILPLFLFIAYLLKGNTSQTGAVHVHLKRILNIILVVGLLSVVGYLTFFHLIWYGIPFANAVRELGRYGVLLSFAASLMIGLAVDNMSALKQSLFQQSPTLKFCLLLLLCLNALYLVIFEQPIPFRVSVPFLLGFLFFLFLKISKNNAFLLILLVSSIFVDLYLNHVTHGSTLSANYPARYYRKNRILDTLEKAYGKYRVTYDMQKDDSLRRNIGDIYDIQTKMGYGATMNKPYADFLKRGWELNSEVNDLLNIKYVITDKILDSNYIFKDSAAHLNLYERPNYYPRIYWKRQLGKPGRAIEEENKETIKQLAYSDYNQKIEVECMAADTLIISENYYPGWKCSDNGKKTAIFPAHIKDYPPIFRSIALDKGHHVIEFSYNKVFYWF